MRSLVTKVKDKVTEAVTKTSLAVAGMKSKKLSGGKEIVIELLLAAVAIALAILWQTGMGTTISNMITSFANKISGIFS